MINPDFKGVTLRDVKVTTREANWFTTRPAKNRVKVTKVTAKSRTKAANLCRKTPTPQELRRRARLGEGSY